MIILQQTSALAYTTGLLATANIPDVQPNPVASHRATADVVFYSWWRNDGYAKLPAISGFSVEVADDCRLIAAIAHLDRAEVEARLRGDHRPYLARLDGTPIAYGWSARNSASIGELGLEFAVPAGNRYLWDFATLPAWRGLGIYPRLLQAILAREAGEAQRFWIGHVRENRASGRGIVKAGFGTIGVTDRGHAQALRFVANGSIERAHACAALLGLRMKRSRFARAM